MFRRFLIISALAIMAGGIVFADGIECNIEKNYSKSNVELDIKSQANDVLTIGIFPNTVDLSGVWDNIPAENIRTSGDIEIGNPDGMVVYVGSCKTGDDGTAQFTAGIDITGNNNLYVASLKTGEKKVYPLSFTSKADYCTLIGQLNEQIQAGNKDEFYNKLSENAAKIDFVSDITDKVDLRQVSDVLFNNQNGQLFSEENYTENCLTYSVCEMIVALNTGNVIKNASATLKKLTENDAELNGFFEKYITTDAQGEFITSRMEKLSISNTQDMILKLKQALVLTATKYADGYVNLVPVIETYKVLLPNITSTAAKTQVYVNLVGREFANIGEFAAEYNRLVNLYIQNNPSSGGGGGGSTGSLPVVGATPSGSANVQEIYMPFEDIDTSAWVYEAVSTLYNAGIISGKSTNRFSPEANITREEFAKLVICMMGENTQAPDAGFSDVSENSWYSGYVNKAAELGIISGIGDGLFGTGCNITRQDMALMLYRAIRYMGRELSEETIEFDDNNMIAEYAKTAVATLSASGIINGCGDGSFNPMGKATRAESAQMIFGVYKLLK